VFLETHEDEEDVGKGQKVAKKRLGLVVLTIELEERLPQLGLVVPAPRIQTSPYRQPLTRFLNK
jgi:transformation/transcription domain-associated protein